MKKIIYSLVIMIAAGSLFTSCIEQVEPLGIQDMRLAKAEYIRALKDLRAADAEYRRAEAAVQQAIARYEDALTAKVNAETEYQKLLNEYQALLNEARSDTNEFNRVKIANEIDKIEKEMEVRMLEHQRNLAKAEKEMRLAQEDLRVTIRNINLACGDLTANEKVAIYEAAAVYYWLTEKSILYVDSVFQAQQKVDTLKEYKLRFSDTAWDGYELVNVDEYYAAKILEEEARIALLMEQYENIPDTSAQVAEWKAFMDGFDVATDKLNLDLAKLAADKKVYTALQKESIRDFDVTVAEWIEENWETEDGVVFTEPATSAGKKPTEAQYTSKTADSLKIRMIKPDGVDASTWAKFDYLLTSYTTKDFPFSKNTPKNKVIDLGTTSDTATVIVRQDMKDFILGKEGNKADSQEYKWVENKEEKSMKADYGLLGAYDVLARDMVTEETEAASAAAIAAAKKNMDNAEKKFDADRKIVVDGFKNYAPVASAQSNLKDQIEKNGNGAKGMVKAVKDLQTAFKATGTKFNSFDGNDSAKLFAALVEFAKNRESYLDFETSVKPADIDPQNAAKRDSSIFYYSQGKNGAGKPIFAEVKFSELSSTKLDAGEYEYTTANPGDVKKITGDPDSVVNAFANIIDQMASELLVIFDTAADTVDFSKYAPADPILATGLYGKYKLDSWDNPKKILNLDGTEFKPKDLVDKENAFIDSIGKYVAAYNAYWGTSKKLSSADSATIKTYIGKLEDGSADSDVTTAWNNVVTAVNNLCPTNAIYNPVRYSKETFKDYADGSPVVTFTGSGDIYGTKAVSAILTAVDTVNTPQNFYETNSVIANSVIFGQKKADIYTYLKAKETYWKLTTSKATEQLAKVRAEIKKVEDALAADAAQAGKLDEDAYKKAVAKWEAKKAEVDAYLAAKKAFVGVYDVDAEGNEILNPIKANIKKNVAGVDSCSQGNTAWLKTAGVEALFAKNIVGLYVGWNETLGGEQLELAEELFGEEPWEEYNEWKLTEDQLNAELAELVTLKANAENVYMARAKYEGLREANTSGATAGTVADLYKAYKDAYEALCNAIVTFDDLTGEVNGGKVKACMDKIEDYRHEAACYKSDVPDWDGLISKAQNELDVLKNRQKAVNQNLSLAKENYDRIREYLLSQDGVSYLIPISTADVDDVIMNLNYIVKQFGYTIAEVAAMVSGAIAAE